MKNKIFFSRERIEELARFLVALRFNGGKFTIKDGPNFGWTVEII